MVETREFWLLNSWIDLCSIGNLWKTFPTLISNKKQQKIRFELPTLDVHTLVNCFLHFSSHFKLYFRPTVSHTVLSAEHWRHYLLSRNQKYVIPQSFIYEIFLSLLFTAKMCGMQCAKHGRCICVSPEIWLWNWNVELINVAHIYTNDDDNFSRPYTYVCIMRNTVSFSLSAENHVDIRIRWLIEPFLLVCMCSCAVSLTKAFIMWNILLMAKASKLVYSTLIHKHTYYIIYGLFFSFLFCLLASLPYNVRLCSVNKANFSCSVFRICNLFFVCGDVWVCVMEMATEKKCSKICGCLLFRVPSTSNPLYGVCCMMVYIKCPMRNFISCDGNSCFLFVRLFLCLTSCQKKREERKKNLRLYGIWHTRTSEKKYHVKLCIFVCSESLILTFFFFFSVWIWILIIKIVQTMAPVCCRVQIHLQRQKVKYQRC